MNPFKRPKAELRFTGYYNIQMDGMFDKEKAINPSKCVLDVADLIIDVEFKKLAFAVYTYRSN